MTPASVPEPLRIALEIAAILDRLGVPYVAAGALASSVHGEPRSTDDVDLVADLRPAHAAALVAALRERYYVDEEAVTRAIADGASFNAIHLGSAVKVDVFVVETDVIGILRAQRGALDTAEMDAWAGRLGVADLLARAWREEQRDSPP